MSAAVATAVKTGSLKLQRRLAMSIFKVGYRKVWLDPKKIPMIAQAKTREHVRDLIAKRAIQVCPATRGKRVKTHKRLSMAHPIFQRIREQYIQKRQQQKATSVQTSVGDNVTTQAL